MITDFLIEELKLCLSLKKKILFSTFPNLSKVYKTYFELKSDYEYGCKNIKQTKEYLIMTFKIFTKIV